MATQVALEDREQAVLLRDDSSPFFVGGWQRVCQKERNESVRSTHQQGIHLNTLVSGREHRVAQVDGSFLNDRLQLSDQRLGDRSIAALTVHDFKRHVLDPSPGSLPAPTLGRARQASLFDWGEIDSEGEFASAAGAARTVPLNRAIERHRRLGQHVGHDMPVDGHSIGDATRTMCSLNHLGGLRLRPWRVTDGRAAEGGVALAAAVRPGAARPGAVSVQWRAG